MQAKSTKIFGLDFAHNPAGAVVAGICDALERKVGGWKYSFFDNAVVDRTTHLGESNLKEYLSLARFHPDAQEIARAKQFSMLHNDVLMLLRLFAFTCKLPVLEIGPYIGGSTVATCCGLRASKRGQPLVSIGMGGSYADHPHVPSKDIVADLKANIAAAGATDIVHLIVGNSRDADVVREVRDVLKGRQIGMIMIDADGSVEHDWAIYGELLGPDAIVVLDDYVSDLASEKATQVKPWVDRMVADNRLRSMGVHGWGTWFGQVIA